MTKILLDLMQRARSWPEDAQVELAEVALEIEAELAQGTYRATPDELLGIERGLRDSANGRFVSEDAVEAVFQKHRPR